MDHSDGLWDCHRHRRFAVPANATRTAALVAPTEVAAKKPRRPFTYEYKRAVLAEGGT